MQNIIKTIKEYKFKKIFKYFLIFFLINSTILILSNFLSYKEIYNENFKLQWYKAYTENDLPTLRKYAKNFKVTYYNIKWECKIVWFYKKDGILQFCKDNQIIKFKEKESDINLYLKEKYIDSIWILIIISLLFVLYMNTLIPYYFKNIKEYKGDILNDIAIKIKTHKDIRTIDLYHLKNSYIEKINSDFKNFYRYRKQIYDLQNITNKYGLIEIQSRLKVLYKELSRIYLYKNKYRGKWLANLFSYYTSRYLTSLSIYLLFLLILLIYNGLMFQYIYFVTTWWLFDKDLLWYIYETVNITSNLWWNTDWNWWIQQLFLMYLTISWVAIFWIFIAILNDKIKLQ